MIRKKYQTIVFAWLLFFFGCCFLIIGQETTGDLTSTETEIIYFFYPGDKALRPKLSGRDMICSYHFVG
jgi:hypothetical protein